MGYFFEQRDGDSVIKSCGYPEGLSGLHTEIILTGGEFRIVAGQRDSLTHSVGDLKHVGKLDRRHERLQLMKSIRTFPKNAERKVDLSGCRD